MSHDNIVLDLDLIRERYNVFNSTFPAEALNGLYEFKADLPPVENLDKLSAVALTERYGLGYLFVYKQIFLEVISRWINYSDREKSILVLDATARIITSYPVAKSLIEQFLNKENEHFITVLQNPSSQDEEQLRIILLAYYRLLNNDKEVFAKYVKPEVLYKIVAKEAIYTTEVIKYLALKVLSLYLDTGEGALHDMVNTHIISHDAIIGRYEMDSHVNYKYLEVNEAKIFSNFSKLPVIPDVFVETPNTRCFIIRPEDISNNVVSICGILVPKINAVPDAQEYIQSLVPTKKAVSALHQLAENIQNSEPMMLIGKAGSGKTFLINELSKYVGCHDSVVKIHLGEQTDAKLLIGTYTSGEKPGTFIWRSGVLTTAVKEGRWVLIEDVDKAPTEVLSILLTLLEKRELTIPSRGEVVKAANGFQLISTVRINEETIKQTTEKNYTLNMLGMRIWRTVELEESSDDDLLEILTQKYPVLSQLVPKLIHAYSGVKNIYLDSRFTALNRGAHARVVSVRDIAKLCNRLQALFENHQIVKPDQLIESQIYDNIFAEAADCFAGAISEPKALEPLVNSIGESLEISNSRIVLYLRKHVPKFENHENFIEIGRSKLQKERLSLVKKTFNITSFATTNHSLRLMEQIAVAVQMIEPILLVGETGTGKTTVVQQLGKLVHRPLTVINVSQQTETGDLLGGYKPVNSKTIALPVQETFESLFASTFSLKKNERFYKTLHKCFNKSQWKNVVRLWNEAYKMAQSMLGLQPIDDREEIDKNTKKKRKLNSHEKKLLLEKWTDFKDMIRKFEAQSDSIDNSFVFNFVEGSLVKAVRNGEWLLLDEINLASADTLESISDLLAESSSRSILISEKGDSEPVKAHPDFRIFACMNPATDVGKKDLPPGIRSRFTEIYVHSPDRDIADLLSIIDKYIYKYSTSDEWVGNDIAELYLEAKKLAENNQIVDGSNQKPHFSIRTLTRTLLYVCDIVHIYGLRRSLYDGFCMSFLTLLSQSSEALLEPIIQKYTLGRLKNLKSIMSQAPPSPGPEYVQFKHYWMKRGPEKITEQAHYIITPFVEKNMMNLVRATSGKRFPVLVQGPTSAGKTSMIKYLADVTGHKFVRINNHEHTDLQEYLGTYITDDTGKLSFREGVLVEALRKGYWIVLDELNLAPTDVLEALNRLLDDNRELFIPETQEVVHPHPDFMLFATQNPPGLYGGRKVLSRAFRNRFLELHFDDIPKDELEIILRERCKIAPSYAKKIVEAYRQLSIERSASRLFEQKNSFATLRDLFRWAFRDAVGYDELAANGYMLLAERCRTPQEKEVVKSTLEKVMKVKLDMNKYYSSLENTSLMSLEGNVIWTQAMRRLSVLVSSCLENNEPVLLVGETGCGKTTICQILSSFMNKKLITLNAHQNTETGDILGAQRPVRNRSELQVKLSQILRATLNLTSEAEQELSLDNLLTMYDAAEKTNLDDHRRQEIKNLRNNLNILFEWSDGPLIHALKDGDFFLLDEISLADDSVLERLNSVLEPERSLLLAEKGSADSFVTAADGFQFFATMNPGGDYGKKELSPALRNRFTEIWVSSMENFDDVRFIVLSKLIPDLKFHADSIVSFSQWFAMKFGGGSTTNGVISLRDILAWVEFMNRTFPSINDTNAVLVHGASMVFVDALGTNNTAYLAESESTLAHLKVECIKKLSALTCQDLAIFLSKTTKIKVSENTLEIGIFKLPVNQMDHAPPAFNWNAPTTSTNLMRVARAMLVKKPILLEGSPGVGKTSLVTALAEVTGNRLTRINLSEQTDLIDLFGSDVPGERTGEFVWRDAPFLRAMQKGEWVLLDEMNLASQSVLEGLNACLDHRGEVYIPELDKSFSCHPNFVVFAAQNPQYQGGGRKGLPKSFVNRFSVVYINVLTADDLLLIAKQLYPNIASDVSSKMIELMSNLEDQVCKKKLWGGLGAPWEFNLRDTLRWLKLMSFQSISEDVQVSDFVDLVVKQRFRSDEDREHAQSLIEKIFGNYSKKDNFYKIDKDYLQVNGEIVRRNPLYHYPTNNNLFPLECNFNVYESALRCINNSWPLILVGPSNSGKTEIVRFLASTIGAKVAIFSMNSDVDSMDILGGYEQVDTTRKISHITNDLHSYLRETLLINLGIDSQNKDAIITGLNLLNYVSQAVVTPETFSAFSHLFYTFFSYSNENRQLQGIANRIKSMAGIIDMEESVRFEWFDGILVKAVEEGQWLILDNANLCSPSVLDRLNSLLETDGSLVINECNQDDGQPRVLFPHPNFRLFLTVNPKYGELSRAMRNRGVEIYVEDLNDRASTFDSLALGLEARWKKEDSGEMEDSLKLLSLNEPQLSLPMKRYMPAYLASVSVFSQLHDIIALSGENPVLESLLGNIPINQLTEIAEWSENIAHNRCFSEHCFTEKLSSFFTFLMNANVVERMITLYVPTQEKLSYILGTGLRKITEQSLIPILNPYTQPVIFNKNGHCETSESLYLLSSLRILLKAISELEQTNLKSISGKISDLSYIELSAASQNGRNIKLPPRIPIFKILKKLTDLVLANVMSGELFIGYCTYKQFWQLLIIWMCAFESSCNKDEARLRVYKDLFEDWASYSEHKGLNIEDFSITFSEFDNAVTLTRGKSIKILWESFRKEYPPTAECWVLWGELLTISKRFDGVVKLQFSESYQEIKALRAIFITLFGDILRNNVMEFRALTSKLELGIDALEDISKKFLVKRKHFFTEEFDNLLRLLFSEQEGSPDAISKLASLCSISTEKIARHQASRCCYPPLLDILWNKRDGRFHSFTETMITSSFFEGIIIKANTLKYYPGSHVKQTLSDAKFLLSSLANFSGNILKDQLGSFAETLYKWIIRVIQVHTKLEVVDLEEDELVKQILAQPNDNFSAIFEQYLLPAMQSSKHHTSAELLGRAWIYFGIALIMLYAPDCPYDPAIHDYVLYDVFLKHKTFSEQMKESWAAVRKVTNGDEIIEVEKLINSTSEIVAPEKPKVYRPTSGIDELFEEWTALINSTVSQNQAIDLMNSMDNWEKISEGRLEMFQQNTSQFLDRLETGYRHYSDLNEIFKGYVLSMKCGFDLMRFEKRQMEKEITASSLWPLDPLSVISSARIREIFTELKKMFKKCSVETISVEKILIFFLQIFRFHGHTSDMTTTLNDVLQTLYYRWSLRHAQAESKMQEQNSIFRYQDSSENYEEDFKRMFPDYEDIMDVTAIDSTGASGELDSINYSIAKIYMTAFDDEHGEDMRHILMNGSGVVEILLKSKNSLKKHNLKGKHLTAVLNKLAEEIEAFEQQSNLEHIDFYKGFSISESQRAVTIVEDLWNTIYEFLTQWPEHATLKELFRICQEFLEYSANTPIAKQLQKIEQIYTFMAEWEKYASSQVSLTAHIKNITNLIISWRKLELLTWNNLLKAEDEAAESSIGKWWFHLFETIIVSNSSIEDSDEKRHMSLVSSLNVFFSKSTFGEFNSRLRLLEAFTKHITLLGWSNSHISHAVHNILVFYGQFKPLIDSYIASGRKKLEKEIKEVILLASWKDVNVDALKQSSRRSHNSLYKVVRKYRTLISGNIYSVIESGVPSTEKIHYASSFQPLLIKEVDLSFAKKLVFEIPDWTSRPEALKNIDVVNVNMQSYARSIFIMEFPNLTDLAKEFALEAERLEQETPKIYSKEDKKKLASLKMQKSKALSDSLKELKRIGLKSSFREDIHKVQLTATAILANIVSFSRAPLKGCDAHFFRIIDMLPRLRNAVSEPSDNIPAVNIEKGMAIVENLIFSLITTREPMRNLAVSYNRFEELRTDLDNMLHSKGEIKYSSMKVNSNRLHQICKWLPILIDYAISTLQTIAYADKSSQDVSFLNNIRERVLDFSREATEAMIWDTSREVLFFEFDKFISEIITQLQDRKLSNSFFVYDVILSWIMEQDLPTFNQQVEEVSLQLVEQAFRKVFTSILLCFQKIVDLGVDSVSEADDNWLSITAKRVIGNTKIVSASATLRNMEAVVKLVKDNDYIARNSVLLKALVTFTMPVINHYQTAMLSILQKSTKFYQNTAHGAYILAVHLQNLANNGFCSPEPPSEEVEDNNLHEGTGLGDGEGAQSNSKDIEQDEDLTEDAQQENNEQKDEDKNDNSEDEDDAVEMEGDMAGELKNMSDQEDNDEELDEQDQDDMDEEIDDIDDEDPNAIDDKMWDEKPDEDSKERNAEKNMENKNDDSDVKAAENDLDNGENGENEGQNDDDIPDNENGTEEDKVEENDEENQEENVGEQEDEVREEKGEDLSADVPEVETMDLPEDINLDSGNEMDEEEDDHNMSDSDGLQDDIDDGKVSDVDSSDEADLDEQDMVMEENLENHELEDETGQHDDEPQSDVEEDNEGLDEDNKTDEGDLQQQQPSEEEAKLENDREEGVEGLDGMDEAVQDENIDPEAAVQQEFGSKGMGSNSKDTEEQQDIGSSGATQNTHEEEQLQDSENKDASRQEAKEALKQLGDSLKEYHKRRQEIIEASNEQDENDEIKKANQRPDEFEHVNGANTETETQALGSAKEEQIQSIDENMAVEDNISEDDNTDEKDIEMIKEEIESERAKSEETNLPDDNNNEENDKKINGGAVIGERNRYLDSDMLKEDFLQEKKEDELNELMDEIDNEVREESKLEEPSRALTESRELWRECEIATAELSARLSEQLRLILEPTLATKLRGDYKTGKRLNMKRIIPYIASQFRKDKIWLRRTKPSKRQYQIMIALDDSKSMSESKCVKLAFDSLCLVSKTLTQLESGGLSIVKFGESIREVHAFDEQFSNEAGAKAFQWFGFNETKTDIKRLVAESIKIFERSRTSSGGDQWQLEIIISDGVCEDHETIQRLVRRARESKIMLVFVIIDGINSNESIMDMSQVKYVPDQFGNVQLKIDKYLDTFPFEFYVVVHDITELPEMLSVILRQYFSDLASS